MGKSFGVLTRHSYPLYYPLLRLLLRPRSAPPSQDKTGVLPLRKRVVAEGNHSRVQRMVKCYQRRVTALMSLDS